MGLKQKGEKAAELFITSESGITGKIIQASVIGGMKNFIFDDNCERCDDCDSLAKNCNKCKYESD